MSPVLALVPCGMDEKKKELAIHTSALISGLSARSIMKFEDPCEAVNVLTAVFTIFGTVCLRPRDGGELHLSLDLHREEGRVSDAVLLGRPIGDLEEVRRRVLQLEAEVVHIVQVAEACRKAYRSGRSLLPLFTK